MRRRVLDHIPADHAERQLKLGSGGLRDVEFAVQLLQMVHGRTDEVVRTPTTLSALARLTERGYVGRDDGRSLHDAYAFLRTLEHRIQLYQLRRTHVMPEDEAALRRLGRSLGYTQGPGARARQAVALPPARGAPAAREALLPPAALRRGQGRRRGPAQPRGRQGAAGRPRLPRPQRCPAPPRGADHRVSPARRRSSAPCCRSCSSGSRTPPTRTPGCSASGGSPRRWARRRGTSGCCATRARRRSGWRRCSRPAATPPTCCSASPRAWRSSARTSASSR